jgi:nucleoside-diphosphate-sugar epimerase
MPNSSLPYADANASASARPDRSGRVLVLGASGFLGEHVRNRLSQLAVDHVSVTRSPRPGFDAAIDLVSAPQDDLNELVSRYAPTAVINCSGAVRGTTTELMRGNVVAVEALLTALSTRAPAARLVQLGSSAEYGAPSGDVPMNEETPTQPSSPYGFTKLAATELVLRARSQGMDVCVLRIFNVSGPNSPTSTMLGGLIEQLRTATERPTITLDSLAGWRDYVDVRDVANAACQAALSPTAVPAIANIGRGEAVQTGDWVKQLVDLSGTSATIAEKLGAAASHKASAGSVAWQCADITVAREHLGWTPSVDLRTSLRDTWLAAAGQ